MRSSTKDEEQGAAAGCWVLGAGCWWVAESMTDD